MKRKGLCSLLIAFWLPLAVAGNNAWHLDYRSPGLLITHKPTQFSVRLGGSIVGDYAYFGNYKSRLFSGVLVRRARSYMRVKYRRWLLLKLSVDAADTPDLEDAYAQVYPAHWFYVTGGQYKPASNVQFLTSALDLEFMERALPVLAFNLPRVAGAQANLHWSWLNVAVGVFGPEDDGTLNGGLRVRSSEPLGWNAKLVFSPFAKRGQHLFFAVSYYDRNTASSGFNRRSMRFTAYPELRAGGAVNLLNTGIVRNASHFQVLNPEMAVVYHAWSAQGGYYAAWVSRQSGFRQLQFHGYYVQIGWFLTGESRPFSQKFDRFLYLKHFDHHYGAVQLALRLSEADLMSGPIRGGRQRDITLALNYYPNTLLRLAINLIHGRLSPDNLGVTTSFNAFGIRAQLRL